MKRFVLALAATVTGLVLLLGFKTQPTPALGVSALPAAGPAAGSSASSPPTSSASATPPVRTSRRHGTTATRTPRSTTRTITGGAANTPYGPVQIQITLAGAKITAVNPVQLPHDQQRSQQIASYAVPQLTQETLSAQSAHIDMVSGATYTSEGYTTSLQSALDQAVR